MGLQESDFESMSEKLNKENMFLFVPEGETKATFDAFKKWQKEVNRKDKEFNPKFGAMEGNCYEGQALTDIAGLPSKKELITRLLKVLKPCPLRLVRVSTLFLINSGVPLGPGEIKSRIINQQQLRHQSLKKRPRPLLPKKLPLLPRKPTRNKYFDLVCSVA